MSASVRYVRIAVSSWMLCWAGSMLPVAADDQQPATGSVPVALVRVRLPITGNADQALQKTLARTTDELLAQARRAAAPRRPLLVLQLEPPPAGVDAVGSPFERVLSLARFLCSRQMAGVKTVAFAPRTIRGHGTLLAIACEEIVMAPTALLGEAAADETAPGAILGTVVAAYREIAETRRTIPVALAIGMIDAAAEVLQVETEVGTEFVLRQDLAELSQRREIIDEKILVPAGSQAQFDGREGRQFGFVKYLAANKRSLAQALDVPVAMLHERDRLAQHWQAVLVDITGAIDARQVSRIETMVGRELERGRTNWLGVRIDSAGGDIASCVRLANYLAGLDANTVRTVAYVPAEASGGAALVALACRQLVMHPAARLGTSSVLPPDAAAESRQEFRERQLAPALVSIRQSLAPRAEKNWSLLMAMLDPEIKLFQYRHKITGAVCLMSTVEAAEREPDQQWQQGQPVQPDQAPLSLDGKRAAKLGLAWQCVDNFDQLQTIYGLQQPPPVLEPNWALEFVAALASPGFAVVLLVMGLWGIYFEVRAPGVGVGAFVALVGLLLFFWSTYLQGTAGWLEVLLFLTGVCCILLEIFVLPGFGIFGLGGGGLVLASLVLASLTFVLPQNSAQVAELTRAVGNIALAGVVVMVMALLTRRYLPQAPLFRRIVLQPPPAEEIAVLSDRESLVDYSHLVGLQGVATTPLRPSGKAEIGDELVDVIAESGALAKGTPLVVVAAHANRVIVRAVGPA